MPTIDYEIFIRFESYVDRMKTYESVIQKKQKSRKVKLSQFFLKKLLTK